MQYLRDNRAMNTTQLVSKPVQSADWIEGAAKAFAVLESFSAERQRLNITQIAQRAGLTRAAARRHVLTLQALGYLEGEPDVRTPSFWLTHRVLRLAGNYLSSARLPRVTQPVLNRLAARGYAFVSLDEALRDHAYQTPDRYLGRFGPSWLHRWRIGLGLLSRLRDEPDPPQWVLDRYQKLMI